MQVRDKYQEFAFRINLTINLTLSLSLSLSLNICKYIYVGPFVILWGPFGLTTTVTLSTHHRTHLSFTRSVISLFNRFVTANPKGRSFNVNLLFVVKICENFSLHWHLLFCIQKGKRKSSFNDTHNSISSCREIGTKPLGLTIFKAFISKRVVKTGKIVFEK